MADYASRVEGSQKMFEIYGLNAIRSDIMTRYLLREDDLLADAIEWVGEQERKLERIDAERRREADAVGCPLEVGDRAVRNDAGPGSKHALQQALVITSRIE